MHFLKQDLLLERQKIFKTLNFWRILSFILLLIVIFKSDKVLKNKENFHQNHIARIKIDNVITYDLEKVNKLTIIKSSKRVKALIVHINSPGGTLVGSEAIFKTLRKIAEKKPVVAVMNDIATSGGYLVALGADRIFALEGTITGSIGVIMQGFEVTELMKKIGVTPIVLKTSKFKASPSPFEKIDHEVESSLRQSLNTSYEIFTDIIKNRRNLTDEKLKQVANGQVFIGKEAIKLGLIDEIGSEEEALNWLKTNKNIDMEINDYSIEKEKDELDFIFDSMSNKVITFLNKLSLKITTRL